MANDKKFVVKKGLVAPNVDFANGGGSITATYLSTSNTLSFSGNTGQLFSITDSMSGTIFSVNDISGIPSIEVIDTGAVKIAETFGTVAIGANTVSGYKFYVSGNTLFGNSVTLNSTLIANGSVGTSGFVLTSNGTGVYWAAANSSISSVLNANNSTYLQNRTWATPFAIGSTTANSGAFTTLTASANVNFDSGTLFTDATTNRVGIGTITPTTGLHVQGDSLVTNNGYFGPNTAYGIQMQRTGNVNYIRSIGTAVGSSELQIGSDNNSTTKIYAHNGQIWIQPGPYHGWNDYRFSDTQALKQIKNFETTGPADHSKIDYTFSNNYSANISSKIVYSINEKGSWKPYLTALSDTGNVSIGSNTTPGQALHVTGSVGITRGIVANGSFGANGTVLTSNGSAVYWGSVSSASGFTGNTVSANATIVKSQSYYVNAAAGWVTMTLPSTVATGDIFIVHSQTGNTRILNNSINIMDVGSGNDLVLESGDTVWLQAVNTSAVGVMFTYPAGGTPAVVGNSSFSTTANNSIYAYGKQESQLYVANAVFATTANNALRFNGKQESQLSVANAVFADTANNALRFNGKQESQLSVANAVFADTANNALRFNGKQEAQLSVANAVYAQSAGSVAGGSVSGTVATANNATYAYGKQESQLSVANSVFAQSANNADYLDGFHSSYFTNATNISTGTLAEPRLPFRMDQNVRTTDNVTFANLTITGSVTVTGNVTTWSANNLQITDNMIYLNANSTISNPDLGFTGNYNDGVYRHAGFFRDASDGVWKVFDQYLPEPNDSANIDTANSSFRIANFQANVVTIASANVGGTLLTSTTYGGTANNSTYAYGKQESQLSVASATSATNAGTANNATYAYGKQESQLSVANAVYAQTAGSVLGGNVSGTVANANNSSYLQTRTWDSPYAIGSTVANSGAFTTITASANVNFDSGTLFTDATSNRVGVGNTTPGQTLQVDGTIGIKNGLVANGSFGTAGHVLTSNGTAIYWAAANANISSIATANNATYAYGKQESQLSVAAAANATFATTANNALRLNGKQESQLSVAIAANATFADTANNALRLNGKQESQLSVANAVYAQSAGSVLGGNVSGTVANANNSTYLDGRTWATPFSIGSTVANTGAFTTLTASANVNFDSGTLFVDGTTNRVGIGTATPFLPLQVSGQTHTSSLSVSTDFGTYTPSGFGQTTPNSGLSVNASSVMAISAFNGILLNTNSTPRFKIDNGGNVAIGETTSTPTKLFVNGHMSLANGFGIYANGTLGANGLVLTSNGTSLYWGSVSASGGGFTGNTVSANSTIVKNQSYNVNAAAGWVTMTMPSTVATGDIFIVHSLGGNTRILNNSINIMDVGAGNDLVLENGETVWLQAVNATAVDILFTYPAGGVPSLIANATFATTANNSLYAYGKQESQLSVASAAQLTTTRTIGDVNFNGTANIVPERINLKDTRAADFAPTTYPGVTLHLKNNGADGLTDGGTYHGILNLQHWTDTSGGNIHQLALTDNNNIWIRQSTNSTAWGSWAQVVTTISGLAANANFATTANNALRLNGKQESQLSVSVSSTANNTTYFQGRTWETAGAIGSTVANTGAFTTVVTANGVADRSGTGGILRLANPGGASYGNNAATVTGALKIKLPVAANNSSTMMRMTVKIYDYNGGGAGTSRSIDLGGYNYIDGGWYNVFATQTTMGGNDINVRFGYDGTGNCIWIGETNSTWAYPQVYITDFQGGYSNVTQAIWGSGWTISAVTALDTVTAGPIIAAKPLTSQNYTTYTSTSTSNNASYLAGRTWGTAGAIGSTVANTGAFTTLTATSLVTSSSITATDPASGTSGAFVVRTNTSNTGIIQIVNNNNTVQFSYMQANSTGYWNWSAGATFGGSVSATTFSGSGAALTGTGTTFTANNATYAYGKQESQLSANNSTYVSNINRGVAPLNLNSTTVSGFYRVNDTQLNKPASNTLSWGQMLTIYGGSDTITQIYGDYATGSLHTRSGNPSDVGGAGSWQPWRKVWDEVNLTNLNQLTNGPGYITSSGSANNATYAYGKQESQLSVAAAANATFATTANNALRFNGKQESQLSVALAANATFATTANNSLYAYGKQESQLSVASATNSTNSTNATNANNSTWLGGRTWASPSAIGSTVANSGAFTTLTTNQHGGVANTVTATTGQVISYAPMNGGRTFYGYDLNGQPALYEARFVNVSASTNVPSGMTTSGYWFGMGAGDVATRGFSLMGTDSNGLWYKAHNGGSWTRVVDTSTITTLTANNALRLNGKQESQLSVSSAATLTTARNINGVSFNGSADITVADSTKLPLAGGTMTGLLVGQSSASTDVNLANDTGSFSVRGSTTTVAAMSFHRTSAYAINMGLGTDSVFRIGGWSAANNCLQINGSGTVTALADFRAPIFYDTDNTAFYFDGASTTNINTLSGNGKTVLETGDSYLRINQSSSFTNGTWFGGVLVRGDGFYAGSNGGTTNSRVYMSSGTYNGTNVIALDGSNGRITALDIRSAIFYDSDNTGYYIDGNNTSNLYRTISYLGGRDTNTNWYTGFQNTPVSSFNFHGDLSSGGPTGTWWFYESMRHSNGTNYWGTQLAWGWEDNANRLFQRNISNGGLSAWVEYLNTSGRVFTGDLIMSSSLRAPIFYDQDNTAYYTNPNGTSVMSSIALGGATSVPQGALWISGEIWITGNGNRIALTTDGSTDSTPNVSLRGSSNDLVVQNWSGSASNDNFWVFGGTRGAACAGNVTAYYSDERLKTKTGILSNALNRVMSLEGFTYIENELAKSVGYNNGKQQVGLSAQQVQEILPEAVSLAPFDYDLQDDGTIKSKSGENYLTVDYSRIVPLLVEAIKEQQAHINKLEDKINSITNNRG